jgi:hypothetical protein
VNPLPTQLLWYRVRAIDIYGNFSFIGFSQPDSSLTGPRLIAGDGSGKTATRYLDLSFVVTNGENIRLANNVDFAADTVLTAAAPEDTLVLPYDLGETAGNDTIFTFYALAFTGDVLSDTSVVTMRVDFRPAFTVAGDPATVATRTIDLAVPASGVRFMRFGLDPASLAAAAWVPGDTVFAGFELNDSANDQTILGEFAGDFGFDVLQTRDVTPDLLQTAVFKLALPDDHITDQLQVKAVSGATAALMRFAESADLAAVPWQAYADTALITLSPGEGQKVVYAQYRNDWADSRVLTDYAIYVSQPAEVAFLAPDDGDAVPGGGALQVRGRALAGSAADSIVAVKFDPGDGSGFQDATGTTDWTYPWNIALYETDTMVNLRARAYVSIALPDTTVIDSVTTIISVTVTQLAVAITSPADADSVDGGATVTISGTAIGILGGDAVDLVTVDVGGVSFDAEGTTNWTVDWQTPRGLTALDVPVTATAWAGAESVTDAIGLVVRPVPILITAPADGAEITGGGTVTIAGQALATLNGAAVDSVRVDIGSERIIATGTTDWSAAWESPSVTENTARKIYASVFAAGAVATDSVAVTLIP